MGQQFILGANSAQEASSRLAAVDRIRKDMGRTGSEVPSKTVRPYFQEQSSPYVYEGDFALKIINTAKEDAPEDLTLFVCNSLFVSPDENADDPFPWTSSCKVNEFSGEVPTKKIKITDLFSGAPSHSEVPSQEYVDASAFIYLHFNYSKDKGRVYHVMYVNNWEPPGVSGVQDSDTDVYFRLGEVLRYYYKPDAEAEVSYRYEPHQTSTGIPQLFWFASCAPVLDEQPEVENPYT